MGKFFDRALGWVITGIFVFGVYAIAHYLLKLSDQSILAYAMCLIWFDLANTINKTEKSE